MAWDPELELPIKLGPCSNGEYRPVPLGTVEQETIRRTRHEADATARRLGMDRRSFLRSVSGAALMLGVLAACHDESNRATWRAARVARTACRRTAATDPGAAESALAGDELVFDVQTHYLDYDLSRGGTGISGIDGLANSFPQRACGESDARARASRSTSTSTCCSTSRTRR